MQENHEVMWKSSVEELVEGYKENKEGYSCIFCRKSFVKGKIYQIVRKKNKLNYS